MALVIKHGDRISEFVLEAKLGSGAFGEVWRARHHVWSDEYVAIKLPTEPEYVRYLQREGVVVHGLRHPNIVRVLGLDPYAEQPYLTMELVDGPSLRDVLDRYRGGMLFDGVATITRGVLSAIAVAHENGVLHRDLKPGNVLLNLAGRDVDELRVEDVKVGDFGLGVRTGDALRSMAQSVSMEREEKLVGTLAYMAPEVRDGQQPDERSDLFAIGVMLFEMLTGERPAGVELPSTVRPEAEPLDDLFRKLCSGYERRIASAAAALEVLDAACPPVVAGRGVPPIPPTTPVVGYIRRCQECQTVAERDDQFCTECGHQLVDHLRTCASCGGFPSPDDRFCIFCGARLPEPQGAA